MKLRNQAALAFAVLTAFTATSHAAVTRDIKCEAARLKLAATYSSCMLKAESAALLKSATPDFTKCNQKFDDKCAAIETKFGSACPAASSCSSIRDAARCASDALPVSSGGGDSVAVTALTGEHLYHDEVDSRRTVDVGVTFPDASVSFGSVVMHFSLACPEGNCDVWNRRGSVSIVENPGGAEIPIEISRFSTPFGVGRRGTWT